MKNLIRRTAASSPPPSSSSSLVPLPSGFIELLGRTNFSFLQGASHPEEMISQAIASGYRGIGICDLNGLYGVVRGYEMITKPSLFTASAEPPENFKYLIGSEISTVEGVHITLMPKNKRGYAHLCALLTLGKRNAEKGFSKISLQDLLEHSDECLAFFLPPWKPDLLETCRRHFGDRLYLPVWRDLSWTSLEFCNEAFDLERQGYQLFATQRPFMHARDRKPLFDVLTCLLHKTTFDEAAGLFVSNGERCLHPLAELARLWKDRPDLLERTLEIASRVNFSLSEIRYRYPAGFLPFGMTASQYLRHLVEEGIPWRFPNGIEDDYRQRIDHELSIIQDLGYEDYFLTLFEICEFAKAKKIFYQGRGSAANSLVCYCLGLTSVHPKQVDLLFERFISKERGEPPDIDIDFEHERREEVIQHIYERYGPLHSAMVCNVVRFRSRMAFREVAKTLGISPEKIGQVVSYMGRDGLKRLVGNQALADQFQIHAGRWEKLLQLASQIHGFPRHLSIHSGGFVITQDPLTEIAPVEKATMEGRYVIQWNKDDVNALGFMKIDLLSLGMLSCLRKSFHLLKEKKGIDMNLATVPQDDAPTYEMIGKADTIGVFQIESRAQMATLPRMKPANFYDIVIEVALVRPGPLQGGMVHPFLRRRQGLEKVTYPHESLIPILKRTAGIPLFQEQVMKIAIVAAGFTPGEADELRRMMTSAWQKPGIMAGVHAKIVNGMRERGYPEGFARQIYKTIEGFSSYG
ncbi:MAG TPA: PHP domain-containing protein, partial [Pseudobdellovibrionaceae bacterium]|nr:PHP domain-containing protein [Pseudobdellovibrionaceae bacterium]